MPQAQQPTSPGALLNLTLVVEGVFLLIATGWSHYAGIDLRKFFFFNGLIPLIAIGSGILTSLSGYLLYRMGGKIILLRKLKETVDTYLVPLSATLNPIEIVTIACVSGFCEEILFRGVAQQACGLVTASLAFGLLHDPSLRNLSYSMLTFVGGMILGVLLLFTGSLWTPIIAHAIHNLISFLILRYLMKPPEAPVGES